MVGPVGIMNGGQDHFKDNGHEQKILLLGNVRD